MKKSIFSTNKRAKVRRTAFNLSHDRKTSMKMGKLYPILSEEVVPGDTWKVNTASFMRFAPMIAPVMHKVDVFTHYYFVPNRLIWNEWENFITGNPESTELPPTIKNFTVKVGDLGDHLGLPAPVTPDMMTNGNISALPFRAYLKIFNEYYRDQNLQNEIDIENEANYQDVLDRAWQKDYFTSARPWTQKGGEGILPIHTTWDSEFNVRKPALVFDVNGVPAAGDLFASDGMLKIGAPHDETGFMMTQNDQTMRAEMTINEFRIAHRIQKWFEKQARGGSRYAEVLLHHFDQFAGDATLQRPQFLGGGKVPVTISEVLNTNGDAQDTPQGHMSGHGISVGNAAGFNKTFREHGYIIGIMSVMPKPAYQQGIHKSWLRQDKFDYYWPEFANLGEQEVVKGELFWSDDIEMNKETFGYQSRYAEYKYKADSVHGDMRTNLNFYHMGRIFQDIPELNEEFIKCDTTAINMRVFAAGELADQLWAQIHHNITAIRPMPYYGTPTL